MGVRNLYSIDVDPKTDKIAAAWVGPDQGTNSTTWGPAKTENAAIMSSAGNYGWPYCQGGNRFDYRAKLPSDDGRRRRGEPRRQRPRHGRRRRRRPDGRATGTARRKPVRQRLAVQHGPRRTSRPRSRPTSGTARRAVATTSRATPTAWPIYNGTNTTRRHRPRTAAARCLRWQPGADDRGHLPQAGRRQRRRLARLLGRPLVPVGLRRRQQPPPRAADGPGRRSHQGRPAGLGRLAVRDHPDQPDERQPHHRPGLRSRRRALRGRATRARTSRSPTPTPASGASPTSAATTPRVPTRRPRPTPNSTPVNFNIGKSGGVSYEWTFADGAHGDRRDRRRHTYLNGGHARRPR